MNAAHLIDLIRSGPEGREKAMEQMYHNKKLRGNTIKFILNKGGDQEEAESVFCDAIINFVKSCYKKDFTIHSSIENYLFVVTRNLWYRSLKEKKELKNIDNIPEDIDDNTPELILIGREQHQHLYKILNKIEVKCRKILTLWARNMKMKMIAKEMNYSSPEVVRKKKHFCLKKLITLVDQHPEYQELLKSYQ